MGNDGKEKMLQRAIKQVEKDHGKGTIMKLGDDFHVDIDAISTGSLKIDKALGIRGIPRGRVSEIYGPEASGKTTLALHIIAEAQKEGGVAAFIDAEHALDPKYAKTIGVDIDNLLISQPDNGEQALDIVETLVRSAAIDIIVVDSVAALTPRAEIEGEMGDSHVGLQARLMSQALRKLTGIISKTKTSLIFLNQIRMKIGVMFGNPETTTGGHALKFYTSCRIEIRRSGSIKKGNDKIGAGARIKIVKNKLAPPFKVTKVDIIYGKGISKINEIIDIAVDNDIIDKRGSWYSYEDLRLGQGTKNVREYLRDNPELLEELEDRVKAQIFEDYESDYNESDADEDNEDNSSEEEEE